MIWCRTLLILCVSVSGLSVMGDGTRPRVAGKSARKKEPAACNKPVNPDFFRTYNQCRSLKSSVAQERGGLIFNTDEKIGYRVDKNGGILQCFSITIGKNGISRGGNNFEDKQTEVGFFTAQVHNGRRYRTNARAYKRRAIGMGVDGGKVIHSDHGREATLGCIGVERAQWPAVFDAVNMGDNVFVWSKSMAECDGSPGTKRAPSNVRGPGQVENPAGPNIDLMPSSDGGAGSVD